MKKEYIRPTIEVKEFDVTENVTALIVSGNALDWVNGTGVGSDSVNWE